MVGLPGFDSNSSEPVHLCQWFPDRVEDCCIVVQVVCYAGIPVECVVSAQLVYILKYYWVYLPLLWILVTAWSIYL